MQIQDEKRPNCPVCNSSKTRKDSVRKTLLENKQRWFCKACGKRWVNSPIRNIKGDPKTVVTVMDLQVFVQLSEGSFTSFSLASSTVQAGTKSLRLLCKKSCRFFCIARMAHPLCQFNVRDAQARPLGCKKALLLHKNPFRIFCGEASIC